MKTLTFWFDLASTYSYLSAMRIDDMADAAGVDVHWRPFLLGPIFAAQGWDTSPFNIYPVKGRYMWRDMQRKCEQYGLRLNIPDTALSNWPRPSVKAARIAIFGLEEGWGREFVRQVYQAEFVYNTDISDESVLADLIGQSGGNAKHALTSAELDPFRGRLRANTEEAIDRGLFGAPSFTVGEELFWGDDRLPDAIDWAAQRG